MSKSKLLISSSAIVLISTAFFVYINALRKNEKVIYSSTLDANLYDTSWLAGNSCDSGCWNGLTPGKTSKADAVTKIKSIPFINKDKLDADESILSFFCNSPMDETRCGMMIFEGDLLEDIILFPKYLITMDQAVEIIGTPDGYSCFPTDPGATGFGLSIFYTNKQLMLVYTESRSIIVTGVNNVCKQANINGKLTKGYPVEDVYFFHPYTIDEMTGAQPWEGFEE